MIRWAETLVVVLVVAFSITACSSDKDRYLDEMAEWHIRWEQSSLDIWERGDMIKDLEAIQVISGRRSADHVLEHRLYQSAHKIYFEIAENCNFLGECYSYFDVKWLISDIRFFAEHTWLEEHLTPAFKRRLQP